MRDWLVSRQRYWGVPIPIVNCGTCGEVPLKEHELPLILPEKLQNIKSIKSGKALESEASFLNAQCPKCGKAAKRETDTLDTFVDSSWYFLRYIDNRNAEKIFESRNVEKWLPVDVYIGGMEHAILHLLYARFVHKFLFMTNYFKEPAEPFRQLITQGLVKGKTFRLKSNGKYIFRDDVKNYKEEELLVSEEKMSKSKGNGVNPIEFIEEFGSDCLRMSLLFYGPNEKDIVWDEGFPKVLQSFLRKIWNYNEELIKALESRASCAHPKEQSPAPNPSFFLKLVEVLESLTNSVQRKDRSLHVCIARLMESFNLMTQKSENQDLDRDLCAAMIYLLHLYPFAPHISSEIWSRLARFDSPLFEDYFGKVKRSNIEEMDLVDLNLIRTLLSNKNMKKIKIFINNKHRGMLELPVSDFESNEKILEKVRSSEELSKFLASKNEKDETIKVIRSPAGKKKDEFVNILI